jgi:hypothetical protein
MILARMINFFAPKKVIWGLQPSLLTVIFVSLDILSFIIQLIGGGMTGPGSAPETVRHGLDIYMGGIGMQQFFISIFLLLAVKFHCEMAEAENSRHINTPSKPGWKRMIFALYASLAAITARIIFRLVEFSGGVGPNNRIIHKEFFAYALDAMPMLVAISAWNISHPGRWLHGTDATMPPSGFKRIFCFCCIKSRKKRASKEYRNEKNPDFDLSTTP